MVNKFLMLMLLLGWGASAQLVKVDVNLDSIAGVIERKDAEIKALKIEVADYKTIIETKDYSNDELKEMINELVWYKKYYAHSKHVITQRIVARIEEMVNNENSKQ